MIFDEPAYYDANRVLDCIKACEGMADPEKEIAQLHTRAEEAERERDLAIAHDRQPYPTADAYEKACTALNALRAEVERKDKALAWYADHKNYVGDGSMVRIGNSLQTFKPILADHGGMARAALAPVVDEKRH